MNSNNNNIYSYGFGQDRIHADLYRVLAEKRKQILILDARKRELFQTVKTFQRENKWLGEGRGPRGLAPVNVYGFNLSHFEVKTRDDGEKIYSAQCLDENIPFRLHVSTTADDKVTKIFFSMSDRTTLLEIKDKLDILAEECCPHLVLTTISQFLYLERFRQQIVRKIRSMNEFQVFYPRFARGNFESPWEFRINREGQRFPNMDLDIKWTMDWDRSFFCLVHRFYVSHSNTNPVLQENLRQLQGGTFRVQNESTLRDCWEEILNNVTNV
ncbi:DNA-directed RNA polymerase subunit B'' [Frankliniella fusca]|uniref:DNA-directed RNA polymerase subunit B n=1 Tax=Frankliniella fusca TaxID=407009 RepID=A0AAE1GSJ8_9NEOP|nr:DNA-directed RNA polymerase subunit B'' [Frankliniella fusca]